MQIDDVGIFVRYSLGHEEYRMTLEDLRKPQIEDDDDWDVVAGRMDLNKAEFLALDRQWDSIIAFYENLVPPRSVGSGSNISGPPPRRYSLDPHDSRHLPCSVLGLSWGAQPAGRFAYVEVDIRHLPGSIEFIREQRRERQYNPHKSARGYWDKVDTGVNAFDYGTDDDVSITTDDSDKENFYPPRQLCTSIKLGSHIAMHRMHALMMNMRECQRLLFPGTACGQFH